MNRPRLRSIRVPLGERSYTIRIGSGLFPRFEAWLARAVPTRRGLVVADRNAHRCHGAGLRRALAGFDIAWLTVPPGEGSKSMAQLDRIHSALQSNEVGRDGFVLAFGGGVVGDLAGFAAATWHRGISLVMVPTTLLAQVDSSVGGKVGINRGGIKNVVGAFHQPTLVVADVSLLHTLPQREFRSALAEVVKYGMVADAGLLRRLERHAEGILAGREDLLCRIVVDCCRIKARIVAQDEKEAGIRAHLNYGHTLGHALEAASGGRLRHGEAVALGMRGAARLAVNLGLLAPSDFDRQEQLLDRLGLPRVALRVGPGDVMDKLKWDKKVRDGAIRFVLTRGVGSASLAPPIPDTQVRRVLAELITTPVRGIRGRRPKGRSAGVGSEESVGRIPRIRGPGRARRAGSSAAER